jgi:NAD+ kinase
MHGSVAHARDGRLPPVTTEPAFQRVAVVVHPTRPVDGAMATLKRWTEQHGIDLVQLANRGEMHRRVAAAAHVDAHDLVIALGGDGTVLGALRTAATPATPVLGVACGSLGALSAVTAEELADALERVWAGDWTPRSLPALTIAAEGGADDWALNDFVVVRRGAGQVAATVTVDDEQYVRLAGDGVVVATALGSSAYSMAAGGPVLAAGTPGFLCTPLAMHGGSAPPLVVPSDATLTIDVRPGHAGFDIEIDGSRGAPPSHRFVVTLHAGKATLVTFRPAGRGLAGLRRRRLITDSPRILARDDRAPAPHEQPPQAL